MLTWLEGYVRSGSLCQARYSPRRVSSFEASKRPVLRAHTLRSGRVGRLAEPRLSARVSAGARTGYTPLLIAVFLGVMGLLIALRGKLLP